LVPGADDQIVLVAGESLLLFVGNSNDKVLQDNFLQAILSWYREITHSIPKTSEDQTISNRVLKLLVSLQHKQNNSLFRV
jgi:hypothetical protein